MRCKHTENTEPGCTSYSDHNGKIQSGLKDVSQYNKRDIAHVRQLISCVENEYNEKVIPINNSVIIKPEDPGYDHFPSKKEMEKFGEVHIIQTKEELDAWLQGEIIQTRSRCNENPILYRGQADASWLMKSTLLRLNEKLGCDFACMEDRHFQHVNQHVKEWIAQEGLGEVPNEDQILFYAQHYDQNSSLLDFTLNPYIALFFATQREEAVYKDSDLADYVSVIKIDNKEQDFFNWRNEKQIYNEESVVETLKSINAPVWIAEAWNDNKRMTAQEGVFVYLAKHSAHSVEAVFKAATTDRGWKQMISYHLVSRKLIPYIKKVLSSQGITGDKLCLE